MATGLAAGGLIPADACWAAFKMSKISVRSVSEHAVFWPWARPLAMMAFVALVDDFETMAISALATNRDSSSFWLAVRNLHFC